MAQPAATLLLNCYHQAKFVRQAVRSALAQDFSPLEILITDNGSRDGTFSILEEEVAAYRGAQSVRLDRIEHNIGEVRLLARTVAAARGEFVALASGDDIQHPDRIRRQVSVLRDQAVSLAAGQVRIIDAAGAVTGPLTQITESRRLKSREILDHDLKKTTAGSGFAWRRDIFERFGPLDPRRDSWAVDRTLDLRALVLRGVYFMADPVIDYRRHDSNLSKTVYDEAASEMVNEEKIHVYKIITQSARLADLTAFGTANPGDTRIEALRRWMMNWIGDEVQRWLRCRSQLLSHGLNSRWHAHPLMASGMPDGLGSVEAV